MENFNESQVYGESRAELESNGPATASRAYIYYREYINYKQELAVEYFELFALERKWNVSFP